jgi:hypothetical protein
MQWLTRTELQQSSNSLTHSLTNTLRSTALNSLNRLKLNSLSSLFSHLRLPSQETPPILQLLLNSNSQQRERELLYDWRFTANHFVLATIPLRLTNSNFFFQLNTCGYSSYVTSSLTRGWVCRLQLFLALASRVITRSESRGIHDHVSLPQTRESGNLERQIPVFISPRKRVTRLYPQALGLHSNKFWKEPNSQLVLIPRYIASGGLQQKTSFPSLELKILRYLLVFSLSQKPVYQVVA